MDTPEGSGRRLKTGVWVSKCKRAVAKSSDRLKVVLY